MHVLDPFGCRSSKLFAAGLVILNANACFSQRELPARTQPPRELPAIAIEPAPQAPGTGRMALDSTDGPAVVDEVVANSSGEIFAGRGFAFASAASTKPVCTTPCVADLPYGNHQLIFRSVGNDGSYVSTVVAGAKPSIYRVAPTRTSGPTAHTLAFTIDMLAVMALVLGPSMMVAASARAAHDSGHADEFRSNGATITLVGAIALGVGIGIDFAGRGSIQPGNGVQWAPADGAFYKKKVE